MSGPFEHLGPRDGKKYADLQGRLNNHFVIFVDIHLAWESILADDFPLLANGWCFRLVAYYPENRFVKGMISLGRIIYLE